MNWCSKCTICVEVNAVRSLADARSLLDADDGIWWWSSKDEGEWDEVECECEWWWLLEPINSK